MSAAVQNVRVDHRRVNELVTQQFLDRANIVAIDQQARCERMAKRRAHHSFRETRFADSGILLTKGWFDGTPTS